MKYCVYKHTSPNGKVYIGITKRNPLERWENGHGYRDNKRFFNDIVKYGWDNIHHEIMFTDLNESDARYKEAELIAYYESYKSKHGYNVQRGLEYGFIEVKPYKDYRTKMSREEYREYCKTHEYKLMCVPKHRTTKEVCQYDLNGNLIARYDSIKEACQQVNGNRYGIRDCLNGRHKTYKGFVWRSPPPSF